MELCNKAPHSSFTCRLQEGLDMAVAAGQESARTGIMPPFLYRYAISEINALLWLLFVVVTGLLLHRALQLRRLWVKGNCLPGPPLPLLGSHASAIAKAGGLVGYLGALHKEYGAVVRLWLGPAQLLVSVKNRDLIGKVLMHAKDRVPASGRALRLAFGSSSLFTASMTEAKNRRPLKYEELNGKLSHQIHSTCQRVVGQLKTWAKQNDVGWELDCHSASQRMAFTVLGVTVFGESYLTWPAADEFERLLISISKEALFWSTYPIMPFWNKVFRRYQSDCSRLQVLTEEMIERSTRQHESFVAHKHGSSDSEDMWRPSTAEGTSTDVIHGLVAAESWSKSFGSREEFRGSLIGMMFHGALSTADVLGGVLLQLAQHASIQEKVHSEIKSIYDMRSPPTADDVEKMQYLKATLHESARLLPTGPLLQRCSLLQDMKLSPTVTAPAGAILVVPVQLVQTDECEWGNDVGVFNPERFLHRTTSSGSTSSHNEKSFQLKEQGRETDTIAKDADMTIDQEKGNGSDDIEKSKVVFKDPRANFSFLVFGSGSRACIARNFSITGVMTLLASLLQLYEIKYAKQYTADSKSEHGLSSKSASNPELVFIPKCYL